MLHYIVVLIKHILNAILSCKTYFILNALKVPNKVTIIIIQSNARLNLCAPASVASNKVWR